MDAGSKTAIALGSVALIGVAAFYALKQGVGGNAGKWLLQTTAGTGGTITPSSASGIYESPGQVVNVVITANSGYTIGQVLQNGSPINSSTTDTTETYQITMNMNQEIDVVFYQGGQPPVGAPYQIQAQNQQAIVWGYYGAKVIQTDVLASVISIKTCDQNWNFGAWAVTEIQFRVIDSNGKGIPDIIVNGQHSLPVALYPSLVPDSSKYKGYLILNDQMISQSNPLILYPNSNGIVTVRLSYYYGLNDNFLQICQDAQLYLWALIGVLPVGVTVEDGAQIAGSVYSKGGHGVTGQGPAAMGGMQPNTVIAQIVGTSIQTASSLCSCGFNIKML